MAKKDIDAPLEDIERGKDSQAEESKKIEENESDQKVNKTEVKNAHASGLGSIGRNDHRLDDVKPNFDNY